MTERQDAARLSHHLTDTAYPYPSPYQDAPPPSAGELRQLEREMQEAREHLRALAAQAREGAGSF